MSGSATSAGRGAHGGGKLTWSDFALGPPVDSEADRDWTAYEALSGKREQILVRLGRCARGCSATAYDEP